MTLLMVKARCAEKLSENGFRAKLTMNQVNLSSKTKCKCRIFQGGGLHYGLSTSDVFFFKSLNMLKLLI